MKKISALLTSLSSLSLTVPAFAAGPLDTPVMINPPAGRAIPGNTQLNTIIQNTVTIIFVIAALLVLFYLVIGAIQWITSGGEKENVAKARSRITHALIGFAILALAFLIVNVVGQLLGIQILGGEIPPLTKPPGPVNP